MARSSRVTVEANKMRVLAYLVVRAEQEPGASTSHKAMVRDLGLSEGRVRTAYRALVDDGLLHVEYCYDEDGGQRANVYTPSSEARIALAEFLARKDQGFRGTCGLPPTEVMGRWAVSRAGGHPCQG